MLNAELLSSGSLLPEAGMYEELNAAGEPTGERVIAGKGERLPVSPVWFSWRLIVRPQQDEEA